MVISFRMVGLSIGKFGLLFSALGIGVGFGIRNVAANFVSGIIILFERPIEVGEFVEIEGKVGRIQTIKLRSTDVIVDKEGPSLFRISILLNKSSKAVRVRPSWQT
ncbi:mechanosensitive ion channel domain-containing protein [Sporosarcina sp. Te-1]|uniref:mechanosensitive ion channel domain-containing protein n=1 Tax=Sporosarcina sp. Te-1 TaxID=2818390 RepID=UPI001A9FB384|nr:mechanosensitive ion channel domain-containing protein [Sporosarcina sp. Te-1]QTD41799.1 mechanosensitive ion channel [Sporosarcina sp. Te-1]